MDCSPPGSSVHGSLQVRILEWAAISFSRGFSQHRDWTQACLHCRQILYHLSYQWSPLTSIVVHSLFSCSVMSDSLWPYGSQHSGRPCPSPTPGVCSNSCLLSQWCHPTISSLMPPSSPALSLSQNQGLFQWIDSSHQVAKVLELQLQHQSFQWIFRTDFL